MADSTSLIFRILADSKQAQDEIKNVRRVYDDQLRDIKKSANDNKINLGSALGLDSAETAQIEAGLKGIASDLALVVGPGLAVAAAAGAAALAIYELASAAATGSSEVYNLSLRTGFTAETMSALGLALEPLGGNINTVSGALIIFQKNMEKAQEDGSEMSKLFKQNSIDAHDNEKAFRQALTALANLTDEQERTALGAKLFGRSVRDLEAVIRENGGDIDGLIQKYSEYNTLIGTDAARAGHEFTKSQVELQQQFKAAERELGQEFYPLVIEAMGTFTQFLRENGGAIRWWGQAIAAAVKDLANWSDTLSYFVASGGGGGALLVWLEYARLAWLQYTGAVKGAAEASAGVNLPDRPVAGGDAGSASVFRPGGFVGDTGRTKSAKQKKGPEDYGIDLLQQLNKEYEGLTDKTKLASISLTILDDKYKGLSASTRDLIFQKAKLIDSTKAEQDINRQLTATSEAVREHYRQMLRQIEDLATGGASAYTEFERYVEDTNRSLRGTGKALDDATVSFGRFLALTITLSQSWLDNKDHLDAYIESMGELFKVISGGGHDVSEGLTSGIGDAPALQKQLDVFDEFSRVMGDVFGLGKEQSQEFGNILASTFGKVADAVGQAVYAFALFGKVEGGFRKFAAEVIASVAQMAVVQAIFEAAQGLAMLALTYFTGNPKYAASAGAHFAAAAAYGLVGGVATVAARGIAGAAFAQQGSGASASGGASSGSTPSGKGVSSPENPGYKEARYGTGAQSVDINLNVKHDDGHVEKQLVRIYNNNGTWRATLQNDLGSGGFQPA